MLESAISADPSLPPTRLLWSGMTHRGKIRANNEDAFLAVTFDGHQVNYLGKTGEAPLAKNDFVFAISDGMGGANSGEFASRIVVDKITRLLPRSFRMAAGGMSTGFSDILAEMFGSVHQDLTNLGKSYEECAGMGATLSLCWFTPGWMYFGHIGDSRIYYVPRQGPMVQVTHDHNHVGWLRRQGKINEREARTHPLRSSLHQSLGSSHQFVEPQVGAVGCQPGERFLLCSDGLIDGLWDRRIEEMLRANTPAQDLARVMIEESMESSGRDNLTAIVVEVQKTAV
jgi:PPM family protein phosphatase